MYKCSICCTFFIRFCESTNYIKMKYWKYSLWLSILSFTILIISLLLPASYSVFVWKKFGVDAGILFPVLLASWVMSLFAIAYNNIFADEIYLHKTNEANEMRRLKKYLPSLLSLPALISFVWFCCRWFIGKPVS